MKLAPTAQKFPRALETLSRIGQPSYAEIGELAKLTPDEVEAAYLDLLRMGCIELKPSVTNRGRKAMSRQAAA